MARAAAVALILLAAWTRSAAGQEPVRPAEPPATAPKPPPRGKGGTPPPQGRDGQGERRLDEVRITGSAESPDVLFFLPRARFRLLPLPAGTDWKGRLLADSPDLETSPR